MTVLYNSEYQLFQNRNYRVHSLKTETLESELFGLLITVYTINIS